MTTMQAFEKLNTNLISQITNDTLIDMHINKKWRTPQEDPGFEIEPNTNWLEVVGQVAIYMEPEKSHPTVILYVSLGQGTMFAFTLTNTFRLIKFKIEDIMNRIKLSVPTAGNLNRSVNVPPVFPLTVHDVAHLLATNNFQTYYTNRARHLL